jgi:hypothetical protein
VAPADLATIYNFNPVFTGGNTGQNQTIYLIENASVYTGSPPTMPPPDWTTFRSAFLPTYTPLPSLTTINPPPSSGPNNCTAPAVSNVPEATIDIEYASAAAPGAALVVVSCADSPPTSGLYIAIQNLINSTTYSPTIISMSYGESETNIGQTANAMFYSLYQTAVGMGISVFVSAGDAGPAESDRSSGGQNQPIAVHGININGYASTPYNVAVGGTDFSDTYSGTTSTYWNTAISTGATNYGSALSYIPEIPWNDTCANRLLASSQGYGTTYGSAGFCNSNYVVSTNTALLEPRGGSGGPSACATGAASTPGVVSGTCAGYPTPSWQTAVFGLPSNGVRVLPDVALFAAAGPWHHAYIFCYSGPPSPQKNCTGTPASNPAGWSYYGAGTSFAAPIMAGIQALVNQKAGGPQGNPNYRLYQLAAQEYGASGSVACNSSNGNAVGASCIFHDITMGDNAVPCAADSGTFYNCYLPSGTNGVLSTSNSAYMPAFQATIGWDYTTGLGSVNVNNLVNSWNVHTNTHDYNGDGKSDIAWRDGSGNTYIWMMNGASQLSKTALGNVPTTWAIVGQRDFNGDGTSDLLWRDTSGDTAIWFMDGPQPFSNAALGNIPTTWSVVGTGIFPGEGSSSIFWRDNNSNYAMWLVSASTVGGTVAVTVPASVGLGNVPTATWSLAGVGDFKGDGQSDLLWSDTSGNYSIWFMSGTSVQSSTSIGNLSGWSVAGIGDFNGDGKSDIVWKDGSGDYAIWLMNGATVIASGSLGNIPAPFSIVQTGDYDGNGTSDLLWSNTAGTTSNISIWFMNGVSVSSTAFVDTVPSTWTVQSLNAD